VAALATSDIRRGSGSVAGAGNGSGFGGSTGVAPGAVKGAVSAAGAVSTENNTPLTSPIRGNPTPAAAGGFGGVKRRNVSITGLDSSSGSPEDVEEADTHEERRKQPVKRACNECRQQKVSHYRKIQLFSTDCSDGLAGVS
jgi:hypothetical protein